MASVITLEGLKSDALPPRESKCAETVMVYSSVLGEEVPICKSDVERVAAKVGVKRRRGRPRGTTIKSGAKAPTVKSCKSPVWVEKNGRGICKCRASDNAQILPHSACGRQKRSKGKG